MLVHKEEQPYELPENWEWVRLGSIFNIERGGSPRPINEFLTDDEDGINWIKIGNTSEKSKYINVSKEKIIKEGINKSRYVKKGELLLTNSMSYGRPYILNCNGCIHDGWLVLRPDTNLNIELFYYLLTTPYIKNVFDSEAKGSTVRNLNKDIVKEVYVPLPLIEEQKEIVRILESVLDRENRVSELLSLMKSISLLEKSILDKAFRGKI